MNKFIFRKIFRSRIRDEYYVSHIREPIEEIEKKLKEKIILTHVTGGNNESQR